MITRILTYRLASATALAAATLVSTLVAPKAHAAIDVKLTGFVKAAVIGSDQAVQSYGAKNYVAPTSARPTYNLTTGAANNDGGLSFQTAQSRFGLVATVDEATKGILEFDLVDFNRSSPTVQQYPRVRIAKIEHRLNEKFLVQIGQDWDIFSPLNTFTYNYVGNTFQAGNSGFMRQQAVLVHTTEGFEQKAAISMFTANPGSPPVAGAASINDSERGAVPAVAYSAAFGTSPNRVGASAFYSRFIVRPASGREMADVYGLNAFAEQKWGAFDFRAEAYYGQNLNNSNSMLTLAARTAASDDVTEAGGWISGRLPLSERTNLFGSVGYATVLDESKAALGAQITANDTNMAAGSIMSNLAAKLGADHKLTEKLSLFGEVSHFNTRFKISGANAGDATMAEVGLFLFL